MCAHYWATAQVPNWDVELWLTHATASLCVRTPSVVCVKNLAFVYWASTGRRALYEWVGVSFAALRPRSVPFICTVSVFGSVSFGYIDVLVKHVSPAQAAKPRSRQFNKSTTRH